MNRQPFGYSYPIVRFFFIIGFDVDWDIRNVLLEKKVFGHIMVIKWDEN